MQRFSKVSIPHGNNAMSKNVESSSMLFGNIPLTDNKSILFTLLPRTFQTLETSLHQVQHHT